jgi:NTP pyrophosphatase (non-canonical NTP hydrolase)
MNTKKSLDQNLVNFLSKEICKDLNYSEIYELAEGAMVSKLLNEHDLTSLAEEYGDRYDYVFLYSGVDPLSVT